jgi:hypothetical protein
MSAEKEPPVARYLYTFTARGNTIAEIEEELHTLMHGGFLMDSDYGKRDTWNSTSGRNRSVMVQPNPKMTPERYAEELRAWADERKATR